MPRGTRTDEELHAACGNERTADHWPAGASKREDRRVQLSSAVAGLVAFEFLGQLNELPYAHRKNVSPLIVDDTSVA
jgi:hypothetical protein